MYKNTASKIYYIPRQLFKNLTFYINTALNFSTNFSTMPIAQQCLIIDNRVPVRQQKQNEIGASFLSFTQMKKNLIYADYSGLY